MRIRQTALAASFAVALSATLAPPAQAVTVHKKVLVELREEGGFAGFKDRVIVYTDGCARVSRRTGPTVDKCLTGKEIRTLRGHLKHLRVGRSEGPPQGADFLMYTLAYRGHRATRHTLPGSWKPVVQQLEQVRQKYWAPD
ncbi:hypothetical protein GCM10010149_41970 [Nonomuraea roseoviolacea subsp. roseoviolacea]|uniref:Uncharacterized protein n=1 Tax=Nonomuraea roseoviolacea subsp. carminata TaxID=160689 RepID=A0ABT1JZD2_9ACTN|nr:hypothetical protein [Nonomuraea roseoviolacea]MCP2346749.1 hypothetical protein [Nonomuraea roseoviolacea subsp. carminata]